MSYQHAVVVTPHATNANEFRKLYMLATGATPDVTVRPRGSAADVVIPLPADHAVQMELDVILVTAATNATVIGMN